MNQAEPPDKASELKNLVYSGECVAFVGAALSIPPGKNWDNLVTDIATRCCVPLDGTRSKQEVIDMCIEKDEVKCSNALKDVLPQHIETTRTAIVYLHKLSFKALLTTNFDPWIHQQSRQECYKRLHIYPDLPLCIGISKGMYYLHGYFNSDDRNANIRGLVFGKQSFSEAYYRSLLPGFLLNVFVYENILFIGFNPTEEYIANLLRQSMNIRRTIASLYHKSMDAMPKRFILWPAPDNETAEERERWDDIIRKISSLEVTPIIYDRKDKNYRGLEEFLYSWIAEGELKNRPAPFRTGFDMEEIKL